MTDALEPGHVTLLVGTACGGIERYDIPNSELVSPTVDISNDLTATWNWPGGAGPLFCRDVVIQEHATSGKTYAFLAAHHDGVFRLQLNAMSHANPIAFPNPLGTWPIATGTANAKAVALEGTHLVIARGAFDTSFNSLIDGFVTKVSADGSSLVWSTILGGNSYDKVTAIDVDAGGSVVAVSQAASTNMVATADALQSTKPVGASWGHLAKIDATGAHVTYATYLGGSGSVNGIYGVAAGPGGRVACVGETGSTDFPLTPGAFDTTLSGHADGFVASFDLCGGAWLAHGTGCAGTGGAAPSLSGLGCPAPGESVTVSIAGGAPSALGFLLFASTTATLPVTGACSLAIGPLIGPAIPLVLSATGDLSFTSTIPSGAPPGIVQIQTAFLDAAAPDGVSATNALRVKVAY